MVEVFREVCGEVIDDGIEFDTSEIRMSLGAPTGTMTATSALSAPIPARRVK
jgi:hypothetical protein